MRSRMWSCKFTWHRQWATCGGETHTRGRLLRVRAPSRDVPMTRGSDADRRAPLSRVGHNDGELSVRHVIRFTFFSKRRLPFHPPAPAAHACQRGNCNAETPPTAHAAGSPMEQRRPCHWHVMQLERTCYRNTPCNWNTSKKFPFSMCILYY